MGLKNNKYVHLKVSEEFFNVFDTQRRKEAQRRGLNNISQINYSRLLVQSGGFRLGGLNAKRKKR